MKENSGFKQIIPQIYNLLDRKQKQNLLVILLLMVLSAVLSQLTPKAIGWLTDDILKQEKLAFLNLLPVLFLILTVNVINEFLKIGRRIMVEDAVTKTGWNC